MAPDALVKRRGRMREALLHQRLVALFAAALLLFNYPLIALWDHDLTVMGVPLFPAALFGVWALLIVALGWLLESAGSDEPEPAEPAVEAGAEAPGGESRA